MEKVPLTAAGAAAMLCGVVWGGLGAPVLTPFVLNNLARLTRMLHQPLARDPAITALLGEIRAQRHQLAEHAGIRRWIAQRIAYCLRHMNAAREVGKQGNNVVVSFSYQREIPLGGPVFLTFKLKGNSK